MSPESTDPEEAAADHLHTLSGDHEAIHRSLTAWLADRVDSPEVSAFSFPTGTGVSSDTILFELTAVEAGNPVTRRCVARLQPDGANHPVFPRYDLALQARVIRLAGERSPVPVPTIWWEEPDPGPLGTPFFVMERVEGEVPPDIMPYPFGSWLSEADPADQRRLQDGAVGVLADLHTMEVSPQELAFLDDGGPGEGALRRHVDHTRRYYDWVASEGGRTSPLLEAGFAWLETHWPARESPTVVSWGDSRIGNMIFRDFAPVAVLDWEMVGIGPAEIDLGWMVYLHRFLDDIALSAGLPGMPGFMGVADVAATYRERGGSEPGDLEFYGVYAAIRMGAVIFREQQRPLLRAGTPLPDDAESLIIHRASIEEMLEGSYWSRF